MKTTSKIATIVYKNYTENVDMLNPLFNQSELDKITNEDEDVVCVKYYENGKCVNKIAKGESNIEVFIQFDSIHNMYEKCLLFGNRIKFFHMVEGYRDTYKKVKQTSKGLYLDIFGNRSYIQNCVDSTNNRIFIHI